MGAKRTQKFITLFRGVSALSPLVNRAWSAVPVISYLAIGSPNKPRNIIGRPCLEEKLFVPSCDQQKVLSPLRSRPLRQFF